MSVTWSISTLRLFTLPPGGREVSSKACIIYYDNIRHEGEKLQLFYVPIVGAISPFLRLPWPWPCTVQRSTQSVRHSNGSWNVVMEKILFGEKKSWLCLGRVSRATLCILYLRRTTRMHPEFIGVHYYNLFLKKTQKSLVMAGICVASTTPHIVVVLWTDCFL